MSSGPSVFFEEISTGHWPLVAWHLLRGRKVCVFDFTYRLKYLGWLRRLILREKIIRIYTQFSRADGAAIDAAEWLYPRLPRHPAILSLGVLFGQEETDAVLKSALTESLVRYFFMLFYFEDPAQREGAILISESVRRWGPLLSGWDRHPSGAFFGVRRPVISSLWSGWTASFQKALRYWPRYAVLGLYAASAGLIRKLRPVHAGRNRKEGVRYLYAISGPLHLKRAGTRRFDFLLDGRNLTKQNTAFLLDAGIEKGWAEQVRAEGYRVFRMADYGNGKQLLLDPPRNGRLGGGLEDRRGCLVRFLGRFPGYMKRCSRACAR